jgi:hypothetical protein
LGPAKVRQVKDNRIQLEFPDQLVWALSALVLPYQPTPGDTVLAVGQNGAWYVIGILQGFGKTAFTVPGDFEIVAPRGAISFTAAKGLHLKSAEVKITAKKLELSAQSIFERFTDATRWVKQAFQIRAGRVNAVVRSDYRVKAERIIERAEDDVKIDGRKIHLG